MSDLILGIDFGGTKNAAALAEIGATKWLNFRRQKSLPNANAKSDLEAALNLSRELLLHNPGQLRAVGVSFGGPVDFDGGVVKLSYHVPGWEGVALRERLENEFRVPVSVDNDANAGALGEWEFGAGSNCSSLLYITVSTGIGGGWILNGQPFRGVNSMAGEIGHLIVNPNGPQCACGKYGCLEAQACGPAISRQAAARLETEILAGTILRRLCENDPSRITAEMVSQAAGEGDKLAEAVLREAARSLGLGIGQVLVTINPARIVLGGGVTKAGKIYWDEVRHSASEYSLPDITVDIVPAKLKDDAPLWGAISLAKQLFLERS